MFQVIEGQNVYVVDLSELPTEPITDGGNPGLRLYAEALNAALENGIVAEPGKYAIKIVQTPEHHLKYEIFAIKE